MVSLGWNPRNADRDMFYNSVDTSDYGAFSDPSGHMSWGLQNPFNELLGNNSQGGESDSEEDDGDEENDGYDERNHF
ncbi:COMM domain-containing protein 2 [Phytophthora cinnamomi]|uniref:COMM domain-containing protein 2 n=1 Tax=Phytophthora cinnamomi TaxID=4785 RepID=UPI00355A32E7|nr:COMM domain-containing protein 2 [Phytophthora cinnamomi]